LIGVAAICVTAITWQEYKTKVNERKLVEEAKSLSVRAEQGDTTAQVGLGHMYYDGQGVQQNFAEAARWYRKAAEQGNAKAQYGLGYMYHYGHGVPQDYGEAVQWYRKAADQGDAKGEVNLSLMYYRGLGVPQDYAQAVKWYRKGADQGDAMAQDGLGLMYYQGQGVPQDYAEAARWYRKAADQGFAKAQYDIGCMYYRGQGLPRDHAEAVRWFHKAADQGDENALRFLGLRRTGLNAWSKINLAVILLASLYFLIDSLLPGRNLRDWQQRATALLGITGIFYVGMSLYGVAHKYLLSPVYANAFSLTRWLLAGVSIVIALLWLKYKNGTRRRVGRWPRPQ
jgi:TPR repeat protein